ncbi:MAG: hypothetical protein V4509_02745 [Patescibacteria group bacterium]
MQLLDYLVREVLTVKEVFDTHKDVTEAELLAHTNPNDYGRVTALFMKARM